MIPTTYPGPKIGVSIILEIWGVKITLSTLWRSTLHSCVTATATLISLLHFAMLYGVQVLCKLVQHSVLRQVLTPQISKIIETPIFGSGCVVGTASNA